MANTFKHLTTATTHRDLSRIHQHRRGPTQGHDIEHDPVRRPYSGAESKQATPIKLASDRQSLDFYRSY